jgi:hypothetical protein
MENTGEGGMFVRLVVEDEDFMVCCGGTSYIIYDECFVGSDVTSDVSNEGFDAAIKLEEEYMFPHAEDVYKNISTSYICCMTIASTGASYYDDDKERNWICTFDDLTDEGKELYKQIQQLYPKGVITLQTWLDT